jgi:hypothetical protein
LNSDLTFGSIPSMNGRRLKRVMILAALLAIALGGTWFGLRKLDPTSSADFVSDSPDGKYRCAVFCDDGILGGPYGYEAGLFQGSWPHRELPGQRVKWNYDSVSSSDFQPVWRANGIDISFRTGYGDDRATISGEDVGGSQRWQGP